MKTIFHFPIFEDRYELFNFYILCESNDNALQVSCINVNYSVNRIMKSKTLNHLESTLQALKTQLFRNFPYFEGR